MDKLIKWLENSFAPKLQKITNLTWIVVIKDSMMQLLPFILAGSIFCVGTILNDYIPALPSFWTPFGWTMSKIGLMASFLIPFNYCEKKRFRKQRILAGFTGMMLFMICIDPQSAEEMGRATPCTVPTVCSLPSSPALSLVWSLVRSLSSLSSKRIPSFPTSFVSGLTPCCPSCF